MDMVGSKMMVAMSNASAVASVPSSSSSSPYTPLANGAGRGPTPSSSTSTPRKPVRDSKRRATHSQIERRRREKINDRLVTLRTIVPACAAEIEERKRVRREEEEEARQIAAGEISVKSIAGGKRKRNRRRAAAARRGAAAVAANAGGDQDGAGADGKEEELGLHKLEVLTHTIDYIYDLQAQIQELETGVAVHRKRVNDDDEEADIDEEGQQMEMEDSHYAKRIASSKNGGYFATSPSQSTFAQQQSRYGHEMRPTDNPRPSSTRRSTVSSDISMTSYNTSPAITSIASESPMFSGVNGGASSSSASSVFTSLASPIMSLSAESPILRCNGSSIGGPSPRFSKEKDFAGNGALSNLAYSRGSQPFQQQNYHHHNPNHHQQQQQAHREMDWHMLPAPILPIESSNEGKRYSQGGPQEAPNVPGEKAAEASSAPGGRTHDDAAHLLLSLSSPTDALRPISAVRQTFQQHQKEPSLHRLNSLPNQTSTSHLAKTSSSSLPQRRRNSISPPQARGTQMLPGQSHPHFPLPSNNALASGQPSLRTLKIGRRSVVLGSAPGGAHPSIESNLLPSPPLLALDTPPSTGGGDAPFRDDDQEH